MYIYIYIYIHVDREFWYVYIYILSLTNLRIYKSFLKSFCSTRNIEGCWTFLNSVVRKLVAPVRAQEQTR